jgi:hypothetical protein
VVCVALSVPRSSSAAPSLALSPSDYPHATRIVVLPCSDSEADHYFGPVHRSSFEHLHRLDGVGWMQAGLWSFTTGRGGAARHHATVFAYGIHVFKGKKGSHRALADVKVKTRATRVSRLYARIYHASDAQESLVFLFFTYHEILVESYYEYHGTAPASVARSLRHAFDRQARDLAARARVLDRAIHQPPTATASPTALPPTATTVPTAAPTFTPSASPTASPTRVPTVAPSPTPGPLTLTATTDSTTYQPSSPVVLQVSVTRGTVPVVNASVEATFTFPGAPGFCNMQTDQHGNASCTVSIPSNAQPGSHIQVTISAQAPDGEMAQTTLTLTVTRS